MFYDKLKTIAILSFAIVSTLVVFSGSSAYAMSDVQLTEDEIYNMYFNAKFNQEFNDAFNAQFNADFNLAFNEIFNSRFNEEWLGNNPREVMYYN
jgi:hypothetical protein